MPDFDEKEVPAVRRKGAVVGFFCDQEILSEKEKSREEKHCGFLTGD
jgi:hypothetical protein